MSDGCEQREEEKKRRELEERENQEDRIDREYEDPWKPEQGGS